MHAKVVHCGTAHGAVVGLQFWQNWLWVLVRAPVHELTDWHCGVLTMMPVLGWPTLKHPPFGPGNAAPFDWTQTPEEVAALHWYDTHGGTVGHGCTVVAQALGLPAVAHKAAGTETPPCDETQLAERVMLLAVQPQVRVGHEPSVVRWQLYVMQIGGVHGKEVGWQFWQLVRGAFAVVATPLQPRLV